MKRLTGRACAGMALAAFAALGLEAVLAFGIETPLYGAALRDWTTAQNLLHWTLTCTLWGAACWALCRRSKRRYGFDLLRRGEPMRVWQWAVVAILVTGSLVLSYIDWNGSKVLREWYANGALKFVFQYIYYTFETALLLLILIFGQTALELWLHRNKLPYGGMIAALTWGLGHIFTKDLWTGLVCMVSALAFGSVYLLTNRDVRKAYPIVWLMFVL